MFITPARCGQVAFSEPSYGIGQAFLVPDGNPKDLVDYSSIAGNSELKLAVMAGAVEAGYAEKAGVAQGQLVILPDQASLVSAVRAGRADAAALPALSIAGCTCCAKSRTVVPSDIASVPTSRPSRRITT
jgi:polar amino acid transport system substrate-binding protein